MKDSFKTHSFTVVGNGKLKFNMLLMHGWRFSTEARCNLKWFIFVVEFCKMGGGGQNLSASNLNSVW